MSEHFVLQKRGKKADLKKKSKESHKKKRRRIALEYEMYSCNTWEYSDIFRNINSWYESFRANNADNRLIECENKIKKKEEENEETEGMNINNQINDDPVKDTDFDHHQHGSWRALC